MQARPSTSIADSSHADKIFARGEQLFKSGRYDSAMVYYEKASRLYEAAQNWEGYVRAGTYAAGTMRMLGPIDSSLAKLAQIEEIERVRLGEYHPAMTSLYDGFGIVYLNKGDYDQAISYFQKALAIWQAAAGGPKHDKIAAVLIKIGAMYSEKGRYDLALESFQRALVARKAVDPALKSWETGDLYFYFGNLHIHRAEYDLALEYYSKTMTIWKATRGEALRDFSTANLHHNLGLIYHHQGDYLRALELYQKSLVMCQEQFGERHFSIATRYQSMGNAYLEMGDYSKALEFHQKSLGVKLSLYGERHHHVAYSYGNLGIAHARKGDYEKAMRYYQKTLAIMKTALGRHHPDLAECYNLIGDVHLEKGEYGAALANYQRALQANAIDFANHAIGAKPTLQHVLSEAKLLESLHKKAKALTKRAAASSHAREDLQAALSTCQLAAQLIDQIRRGYKAEAAKFFLAEKTARVYEQAIQIAQALFLATRDPLYQEQAFMFAEKSRAGILLEALSEAEAKKFAGIPDSLLEKERQCRVDLAFYEKSWLGEEAKGKAADSAKVLWWQAKFFDLKRNYEALLARFEAG